jgi:hypothetical protein
MVSPTNSALVNRWCRRPPCGAGVLFRHASPGRPWWRGGVVWRSRWLVPLPLLAAMATTGSAKARRPSLLVGGRGGGGWGWGVLSLADACSSASPSPRVAMVASCSIWWMRLHSSAKELRGSFSPAAYGDKFCRPGRTQWCRAPLPFLRPG